MFKWLAVRIDKEVWGEIYYFKIIEWWLKSKYKAQSTVQTVSVVKNANETKLDLLK